MEEKILKEFLFDRFIVTTLEKIMKDIDNIYISDITLLDKTYSRLNDDSIITLIKTDYEHPIVLEKNLLTNGYILYINPDWYIENQKNIDSLLNYIIKHTTGKTLEIVDGCLVNKKIIDSLCSNKFLESVVLGFIDDKYILTYDDYLKFKDSSIKSVYTLGVEKQLQDNFESIVGYNYKRKLIKYYTYNDLINRNTKNIYLNEKLTEQELENLKYLNSNINIKLEGEAYFSFIEICKKLNELKKSNKVVFCVNSKTKFNDFIFKNIIDNDNIFVELGATEIPIEQYLKFEKLIYKIIEPAKDLSIFEKYIYAYNITKQFKKYKENNYDKNESRNLYSILINEYMVCVGYSNMFGDLLDKLGIKSKYLSVVVDTSYDDVYNHETIFLKPISVNKANHARRYVYIVDEKYKIDGFYISDPTWDNDLDFDYYNYLAITDQEATMEKRYIWMNNNPSELFNVNSIQEFYEKLNLLLNRRNANGNLNAIIKQIIDYLEPLDSKFVDELYKKYNFIKFIWKWPSDITDLIYDVANYVVKHVNNPISGDTIMKAVEVIYKHSYGYNEETLKRKLVEVRKNNQKRNEICFPKRYKIYDDIKKELINNEVNKFGFEDDITIKVI